MCFSVRFLALSVVAAADGMKHGQVFGDCAINVDPDPAALAEIAVVSAATARAFGLVPRVAMLSYATGESGSGESVDKVRAATEQARELAPDEMIEVVGVRVRMRLCVLMHACGRGMAVLICASASVSWLSPSLLPLTA